MGTDHVWDSFILLALLEDADQLDQPLLLPHTGLQKDRFTAAMQDRNLRIARYGQPELRHACTDCFKVVVSPDGSKRA